VKLPLTNPRAGPAVPRHGVTLLLCACMVGLLSACGHEEPAASETQSVAAPASSMAHYEPPGGAEASDSPVAIVRAAGAVEALPKPAAALPMDTSCVTPACHANLVNAKQIHGPVAVANCQSCHAEETGIHVYPLKRPGNETCTFCHPIVGARTHEHAAVEESGCTACHDPHKSEVKFLLKEASVELTCATCHDTPKEKFAHGPFAAGQCTVCHQPHESNNAGLLRQGDQPDHCFSCHTGVQVRVANSPYVHEPAKESCTTCHDAHTSEYPFQLSAPIADSCLSCHTDMAERIKSEPVSHDAVFMDQGCANCHDPHAAAGPNLLRDRADHLCLKCHNQPQQASDGRTIPDMQPTLNRRFLHGPIRAGDCAACHSVHGGENARLLVKRFPDTFYASFDLTNYALCFSCHSEDLVLTEQTDELTGFRDGDRNLHYLHVNRDQKGRTCKTCHDIHGSDRPDHIASDVPFEGSQWAMPINFEKSDAGGSCSPGCHETKTYRRAPAAGDTSGASTAPQEGSS
jgi:predicted CXXCH cytochrome family protein